MAALAAAAKTVELSTRYTKPDDVDDAKVHEVRRLIRAFEVEVARFREFLVNKNVIAA